VGGSVSAVTAQRCSERDREMIGSGAGVEGTTLREPAREVDGMHVGAWSCLEIAAWADEQ
jgi:hypothetical protein